MKKFKKGQTVYLRLSDGKKVEGKYKKQTNDGKHSQASGFMFRIKNEGKR